MKEIDLAEKVVAWLAGEHWEIFQEVKFTGRSGIADIAAVRAGLLWIIECKTSLTFTVLEQAERWQAHFRSIAVPETAGDSGGRGFAYHIAQRYLSLGVIEVKREGVAELFDPPLMRENHREAKRLMVQLTEEHKTYAKAGSSGGGYYSPYRRTMDNVKRFILAHPGCTLKQIIDNLKEHHYSSTACARSSIRVALESYERDWCEIQTTERGVNLYFVHGSDRNRVSDLYPLEAYLNGRQ